jgi:GNAT superfamily N-acetyltransferase
MGSNAKSLNVVVRSLIIEDAAEVAKLCVELGYPASEEELRIRILTLTQSGDRVGLAAIVGTKLLGWIDAAVERHLHIEDIVVIGGLVVAESARGRGVGRMLCAEVEEWARERGFKRVRVRSQTKREDAHRFYQRDGYRTVKASLVFEKNLGE